MTRQRFLELILALALLVALTWPAFAMTPAGTQAEGTLRSAEATARDYSVVEKQNAIAYAGWWSGDYSQPAADLALARLADTGANWISLLATGYQDNIGSTTIYTNTATPTDADLIHVITEAHSLGLQVMLKPHLDLWDDPDHWRGEIGDAFSSEAEWAAWFAAYQDFIWHYAELAEAHGADQFAVGTELVGTTQREADWRAVIAGVRSRYSGPIVYAANHSGEETSITWWDAVDLIGVDAYYPLTGVDNPTVAELIAGWAPHVATLSNLANQWPAKSIILTEIGYRSQDGANRHPWDWWSGGAIDLQEQADAYQAAFESLYDQPWFAGMYWWDWETDPFQGGPCDDGYTPYDKPAEDVVRAWYGAPPRPVPLPMLPDESQTRPIYSDGLEAGWQDWSWSATRDLAATDQVYSGTQAISVTLGAWAGLSLWHEALDTGPYYWLEFHVRGASPGGQRLSAFLHDEQGAELLKRPVDDCRYIEDGAINAGTWKRVRISLQHLNASGRPVTRVNLQDRSGQAGTAFWVDELRLVAARPCPDFDASELVDLDDIQATAARWGADSGDPGWDARFDLDGDGDVDVIDVMRVAAAWQTWCPPPG
ncbi:MAG: hypothetical protein ACE5HA_04645 [Anaerolineae bacterium]